MDVTDASRSDWYKVKTVNRIPAAEGFVASQYLKKTDPVAPVVSPGYLKPVNLASNAASRRNNHAAWQYPLSEPDMPMVTAIAVADCINNMHDVVNYLEVDKSARYARDEHTYCNIYAYDYCYLCKVFLPRVWWSSKALMDLRAGKPVSPVYEVSVSELNANALYAWLEQWGADFGWHRTYDLTELQDQVNQGKAGVISGPNINPLRSGHICCVIPERGDKTASRIGAAVVCPLLSQAGAKNLRYYNNNKWWLLPQIKEFGFWYV